MRFKDNIPPEARTYEARLPVQWADVDIAGIMYFPNYWRFAEYAEMEMFRELGFDYATVFEELDFWLPRVRAEAEYFSPALMGDWLKMRTHVEKVGGSSIRWKTVIFNERTGEASAQMTLTVAAMDRKTRKSTSLPAAIRGALVDR